MRPSRSVAAAVAGFALAAASEASARDLPRSDPDRAAILDAARGNQPVKLVVKDLFRVKGYAFLCALEKEPAGAITGTDGGVDVYQWALVNDGGKWRALDLMGDMAGDLRHVSCKLPPRKGQEPIPVATEGDIVRELVERLEGKIQDDLEFGKVAPELLDWLSLLQRKGVMSDVAVDSRKLRYDATQLTVSLQYCASEACRQENEDAFRNLATRADDPKISSLVWENCRFGLRRGRLGPCRRCLDTMATQPHCRPGMHLVADRKDVDRCVAEIRELCRRELGPDYCR